MYAFFCENLLLSTYGVLFIPIQLIKEKKIESSGKIAKPFYNINTYKVLYPVVIVCTSIKPLCFQPWSILSWFKSWRNILVEELLLYRNRSLSGFLPQCWIHGRQRMKKRLLIGSSLFRPCNPPAFFSSINIERKK